MAPQQFFVKLVPPRSMFARGMAEDGKRLMLDHVNYTKGFFDAGRVLIYGPVLAAAGPFGAAVLEVAGKPEARSLLVGDPTVRTSLNRYELHPMCVAAAPAKAG
jgi:hypothetical protein